MANRDTLLLFDVDGTLTEPRKVVTPEMVEMLREVRKKCVIGIVGGSDFHKQQEQLALFGHDIRKEFDYVFSENGLVAYHNGEIIGKQNIAQYLGEDNMKKIINWTLVEIANIDIPIKRGTFIEYRNGMLNVSPIGRNCSQAERDAFEEYDKIHKVKETLAKKMEAQFADLKLKCVIGGQISMDVFPAGWDKTFCLQFVDKQFPKGKVHFFGDKTYQGGNDFEIYTHDYVTGHAVKTFKDTMKILQEQFLQ